jgi:membrane protein DedA with SNARE-associated domain
LPFKIFVATAGTLEYPRWKFLMTVMLARSFRYYVEGTLAVFYGRRVLTFMRDNGLVIVSVVAALVLIGLVIYILINRKRFAPVLSAESEVDYPEIADNQRSKEGE